MVVEVEGSRTTDRAWLKAQVSPVEDLPSLDEEEMRTASRLGIAPEMYLRSVYATELSRQTLIEQVERYGGAIEKLLKQRFPEATIAALRLTTLKGRLEVLVRAGRHEIEFEIDEDLLERLLTTGSAESLSGLKTVIEMNMASLDNQAEAS